MPEFDTTAQGCRLATSVGGVLTGRGADIIIDDPLKPQEALRGLDCVISDPARSASPKEDFAPPPAALAPHRYRLPRAASSSRGPVSWRARRAPSGSRVMTVR